MICHRPRTRRPRLAPGRPGAILSPAAMPSPAPVAAFRRQDNTVCHGRCGRPLSLQGVRGLIEADFYCYACLMHVTLPLVVLDRLPAEPPEALAAH